MTGHKIYSKLTAVLRKIRYPDKVSGLPDRLSSAAVLLLVGIVVAVLGGLPGWILVSVMALAAIREWVRMVKPADQRLVVESLLIMSAILATAAWGYIIVSLLLAAVVGAVFAGRRVSNWPDRGWLALGFPYVTLGCLALVWLRAVPDEGPLLVLYLIGIVCSTDSAAFFVGRFVGGPLLAPSISPRKTWAGLIAGTFAGGIAGGLMVLLFGGHSLLWGSVLGIALALTCHGGDLLESALKRHYRVKDSGNMIPGHGGLLDRIDGLLASAPALAIVCEVVSRSDSHPGIFTE